MSENDRTPRPDNPDMFDLINRFGARRPARKAHDGVPQPQPGSSAELMGTDYLTNTNTGGGAPTERARDLVERERPSTQVGMHGIPLYRHIDDLPMNSTLDEVAVFFRISTRELSRWLRNGRIAFPRSYRPNGKKGKLLIPKIDVIEASEQLYGGGTQ